MEKKKSISTGVTGGFVNITRTCNTHTQFLNSRTHFFFLAISVKGCETHTKHSTHYKHELEFQSFKERQVGYCIIGSSLPPRLPPPRPSKVLCKV